MLINNSPWIKQLNRTRPVAIIPDNLNTDVVIIGAGIAGVSTAYFVLKNTSHNVLLLDADKVAHGATGHNAGQIVSYFERQFSKLVDEFGLSMTARAQEAIDSAWLLLEEIYADAGLKTEFSQFIGYAGCKDLNELFVHLDNKMYAIEAGLNSEHVLISEESGIIEKIPPKYKNLYVISTTKNILELLETEDKSYIAAITARKGCMNSASFAEELVGFLLNKYSKRFLLGENYPVSKVILKKDEVQLLLKDKTIKSRYAVLCTNGFEKIEIVNEIGGDINSKFHRWISGAVGYMAGYLEESGRPPTAISYLQGEDKVEDDVYFYLTRRPLRDRGDKHNLICIGGPETFMEDTRLYHPHSEEVPDESVKTLDEFTHRTYKHAPKDKIDYKFIWHGLMGYTPTGVRLIGPEPENKNLLYNLGCNGVGILPSIYGGKRISLYLKGYKLEKSIFDPKI